MLVAAVSSGITVLNVSLHLDSATPQASEDSQSHNIHVTGDWTIKVYDLDESLVSHTSFENRPTVEEAQVFADVLSGSVTPGVWSVALYGDVQPPGPCGSLLGGVPAPCWVTQENYVGNVGDWIFRNLIVESRFQGHLSLSDSAIASESDRLQSVWTFLNVCDQQQSPVACGQTDDSGKSSQKIFRYYQQESGITDSGRTGSDH